MDFHPAPPLSLGSDARTRVSPVGLESQMKAEDYSTDTGGHSDLASMDCESAPPFSSTDSISSQEVSHSTECEDTSAMVVDDRSEATSPIPQGPPMEAKVLWSAETLPETKLSQFIQGMVRGLLRSLGEHEIAETVSIRVVSNIPRCFRVHKLVRDHFSVAGMSRRATSPMHAILNEVIVYHPS